MIVTIYSNIAIFVQVFVGYSIYCDIPTNSLDNETSKGLESFLRDTAKVTIEYVPPNNKRTNVAERIYV